MDQVPPIEDTRGVERSQIRRQLQMTVPERVRVMVEAANTMLAIQERARAWPEVWAAAGSWNDVFGIEPHRLVGAGEGIVTEIRTA